MFINRFRKAFGLLALLTFTGSAFAQFDMSRIDPSVDACEDFYQHANGSWLKKTEIPAAFPSWGTWDILITRNREISRTILENAMKDASAKKGSSAQLIGDYTPRAWMKPRSTLPALALSSRSSKRSTL